MSQHSRNFIFRPNLLENNLAAAKQCVKVNNLLEPYFPLEKILMTGHFKNAGEKESMSIYTRNGDCGETSLFSGEKVSKHHARVEAYGDVDELVSCLGLARALSGKYETDMELKGIQQDLMTISAWLATECDSPQRKHLAPVNPGRVKTLEKRIDEMDKALPRLKGFVLPGGSPAAACTHVARTVCRRSERKISCLYAGLDPQPHEAAPILSYMNRLSDFLFVLARSINHEDGIKD